MDDARQNIRARFRPLPIAALVLCAGVASSLTGCSLFVMAGKMLLGDPQVTSPFKQQTGVDLVRDRKRVLLVCTTPAAVIPAGASLRYDLLEHLTRRMKRAGIDVVDGNKVASWMDQNGGYFNHASELAAEFDADYIVHVDIRRFTTREENSPNLYRGHTAGDVFAYAVVPEAGTKTAHQVFSYQFDSYYPEHAPEAAADISSERVFVRRCVDRLSIKLAQVFYDHPMSDGLF